MPVDPRTPVLVGAGQLSQRVDRGEPPLEPVDLIAEAAHRAAVDSGGPDPGAVLAGLDAIRIVLLLSWRYRDPGRLVAARIGAEPAQSLYSTAGGNTPQSMVNRAALDIQAGRADVVLIGGAEAWRTRMAYRAEGGRPPWTIEPEDTPTAAVTGDELDMSHQAEQLRGLMMPVQGYPMFETGLRAHLGRTPAAHLDHIASLWARFSEVAVTNPHAWIQRAYSADEIATPTPDNRLIGAPYTKLMNSNNNVEQGAALLLCSAERASALGIPEDRWVFPHSGTDAHDHAYLSTRWDLYTSPAIRAAGGLALSLAGIGIDDVGPVDLYSCFPSAVQIAARELGLPDDGSRSLTVTGGLSFAGGPWNNYVTHAVATMVGRLRENPSGYGLVTANGGFITKHAIGVYSARPPATPFRWASPQDEVDALPSRAVVAEHDGEVQVEAYTVMHGRDGEPVNGMAAVLLPDGRRAWGTTHDAGVLPAMVDEEFVGRSCRLTPDGQLHF